MPDFDGTGPIGEGPKNGRRRGKCRSSKIKQNENQELNTNDTRFRRRRTNNPGSQVRRGQNAGNRFWEN
jgi:Family of unknown function (DUF5320)